MHSDRLMMFYLTRVETQVSLKSGVHVKKVFIKSNPMIKTQRDKHNRQGNLRNTSNPVTTSDKFNPIRREEC